MVGLVGRAEHISRDSSELVAALHLIHGVLRVALGFLAKPELSGVQRIEQRLHPVERVRPVQRFVLKVFCVLEPTALSAHANLVEGRRPGRAIGGGE